MGGWHDIWVCCCLRPAAPIGRLPLTAALPLNPLPPQAAVPIGLSPARALPLPLPGLPSPSHTPFLSPGNCANGAPGLSLFHCSVSGPHGGGHRPLPLAGCVQVGTPIQAVGGWVGGRVGAQGDQIDGPHPKIPQPNTVTSPCTVLPLLAGPHSPPFLRIPRASSRILAKR